MATKFGIEIPAGHPLLAEVGFNIDPQHGGHKIGAMSDAPQPGDCAASWTMRNAHHLWERLPSFLPVNGHDGSGQDTTVFVCPKWDVDALVTATIVCEAGYAAYMGTGSQHFFYWGVSDDEKMADRIELVRKLDTGELGQQLGDHPQLMGLARVASGDLPLEQKIAVCRAWLMGQQNAILDENAALAKAEVEDGLSDAVAIAFPHGVRLIETKTLGLPSRGRGAAQKLGFDKGATVVVQFARDWKFADGSVGTKFTVTWKGDTTTSRMLFLNMVAQKEAGWGGPNPQPNSFIVGSPMTGSSGVIPEEVAEIASGILSGRAVACANCGGDGVCCTMTQLYFPKCDHDVIGVTQPKTCAMCFPLQCTGCGWVGRASQLKPVDAHEIGAREMDVRRLEHVPDESDLLYEANDHVFYAKQGACPSCSRYMKIRKRENAAARTCSHCSTITPRDNAQCYLCGLEEPRGTEPTSAP